MSIYTRLVWMGCLILAFGGLRMQSQTFGTNAVMRNNYMEIGLSRCAVYGTSALPPGAWGYHPNPGLPGLGFVCDYQKNGWTFASGGGFNYCGDYFVPGSPVEGWSLTFNGVDRINTNTGCTTFNIPGAITRWVNTATIDTMEWTGGVAGMSVFQRTILPNDSLYFVTQVVLCNTTATTMTGVYYGRNLDPDNEQPWTGNFTTTNTIVSQPVGASTDALVTSLGMTGRCFLGLGTRDSRARVNFGGFVTIPADDLYFGVGRTTAVGATSVGDIANGIGFQLGNLAPGECTCLSFVYVLSASMLNSALEATSGIIVSADTTDITATGSTILCKGDSVTLTLGGSAGGYNWTWSPAIGLSSTTGISVNAAPPVTTTYTVTGTPRGFACGTEVVTITVVVDSVVANAGPDRTGCPGEVITIGVPGTPGEVYSWSPTSGIIGSTTTTPTTVTFAAPGDYTYVLTATDPTTGCTDTDTMRVHIDLNPPTSFAATDTVCVGTPANILFTGSPGATGYVWTVGGPATPGSLSGPGPHTVSWSAPGTYTVSMFAIYGVCTTLVANQTIVVVPPVLPSINPVADQCFDGHSFSFSYAGGTVPGASYTWTFGPDATPTSSTATSPSGVTFATPGPKWAVLSVGNYGCLNVDTVFFNLIPQPPPTFSISADSLCVGASATITFTGVTAGAVSYIWNLTGVSVPASLSGPGPHSVYWTTSGMKDITLQVVYAGGCTTTVALDSVMVWDNPVADINPVADQCFLGHSFSFSYGGSLPAGSSLGWAFGPDATPPFSTAASPSGVTFASPGPKYVVLGVSSHGCVDADTVFFNVSPQPTPTFTVLDDTLCAGNPTIITFTGITAGATSYLWTLTGTSVPVTLFGPGPHSVYWTTSGMKDITLAVVYGACTSLVALDSVFIWDNPVADINPVADQCFDGHSFSFSYAGGTVPTATYSWDFGPDATPSSSSATSPSGVTFATPGVKYVVLTIDNASCVDVDTVFFNVNPEPPASFSLASEVCLGAPTTITFTGVPGGATSYLWTLSPGASPATLTGPGPHSVSWSTTGMQYVSLAVVYGPCTTDVFLDSILVHEIPVADIDPVANQCFGFGANSFDFTSSGSYDPAFASYSWTFGPGGVPPTSTSEFPTGVTFATPGPKVVSLQISQHGCVSNLDTVMFTVYPDPDPAISVSGASPCFEGNLFDFTAVPFSPTATYDWSFEDGVPASGSGAVVSGVHFLTCGPKTITLTMTENGCATTITYVHTVYCNPSVDAGLGISFCEGTGGDTIISSLTGGTAPFYYSWWCSTPPCGIDSVFDDDPVVNPDMSMWYYVQVTDVNGCESAVDSIFVTVLPKPLVDAGPDQWLCPSPAPCEIMGVSVSGTAGPFHYQWSPSLGLSNDTIANPCARPDTTTIYTVTVVDLTTGCTSESTTVDSNSTVTVNVVPLPTADAGPDREICDGDTIMLLGIGYGAGPTYTYEWSPFTPPTSLSANNIPNPLAYPSLTTNYVLTVWSNGCPSYGDTVEVQVHTNPTVDAGPDRDICQGESALLDGSAGGDLTSSFYLFDWWDGSTLDNPSLEDPIATPDTTTTYYVQATSEYGCLSPVDSVLITVKSSPIAEAGDPLTLCQGDSVQLNGSYSYSGTPPGGGTTVWPSWTPATSISDTSVFDPWVWPSTTGFYFLHLQENTCGSIDSVLITVMPVPQLALDADTTLICEGDSVQLTTSGGMGGATVTWTPGAGLSDSTIASPMAMPAVTTTYTVTYNEGFCSATDEITVRVIPMPDMAYMSSQVQGCAPLTVSFLETSSDAIAYIWDFGDGSPVSNDPSPTHTYDLPGSYVVTLTGTNYGGCSATISTIVVDVSDPGTAEFTADPNFPAMLYLPETKVEFTDLSQNPTTWLWTFGDGGTSSDQHPTHFFHQPGEYTVTLTITNEHGCISQVHHGPYVIRETDVFIPNVFSPNADGVNDEWWTRYTGDQPFSAQIHDRWGVLLFETKNKMETWRGTTLKGEDAPDGVYFYTVRIGDREFAGDVTLVR